MKLKTTFTLRCTLFAALLPVVLGASASAQSYTVTDLGTLGGQYGSGSGINNAGQVTGTYYDPNAGPYGGYLSVLTGPAGAAPLKAFGLYSNGHAVNASGQVAGQFNNASGHSHAFISSIQGTGGLKDLGSLGGDFSYGLGINSRGQVSGTSLLSYGNVDHAFLSGPNGGPLRDLGTLGGPYSYGVGVNDLGQVSGTSDTAQTTSAGYTISHAFLSGPNGGLLKDLGTLGGLYSGGTRVNVHGQVTGSAQTLTGTHAFLSGPNGALPLKDLGTLAGDASTGDDVNASGMVVGASAYTGSTGQYDTHAFLYANGVMTDLNSMLAPASGIVLTEALAISASGYILASGTNNGQSHTFLLTPRSLLVVNSGPRLIIGATAATDGNGNVGINILTTNVGGINADLVQITTVTLDGIALTPPPIGSVYNVLPTIPDLLTPGQSQTSAVTFSNVSGTAHLLHVSGTYLDPRNNITSYFSGSVRLTLL